MVTVPKTTCDEVTEESKVKGHDEATPTDAPAGEEEKEAGRVEDLNIGTFLTVDEVGQVEEDGGKRSAETGKKHTVYHCYARLVKACRCK